MKRCFYFLLILTILSPSFLLSQTITGRLVDQTGNGLSGLQLKLYISQKAYNAESGVDGSFMFANVSDMNKYDQLPAGYAVSDNYPNPFNPRTRIGFSLPNSGSVIVNIYSLLGEKVSGEIERYYSAGTNFIDLELNGLPNGFYLAKITLDKKYSVIKKLMLMYGSQHLATAGSVNSSFAQFNRPAFYGSSVPDIKIDSLVITGDSIEKNVFTNLPRVINNLSLDDIIINSQEDSSSVLKTVIAPKGWVQVWADEFNYTGLPDSTKWGYDVGNWGWGNNELQYYTYKDINNARVKNGTLIIEARNNVYKNSNYTSARLVTANKADWTYGRFEVRAKVPGGRGLWPAIWMLPTVNTYGNGSWPDNGEMDIMEYVGYDKSNVHATTHCNLYNVKNNNQKTAVTLVPGVETAFHTYALEWNKDTIKIFVDATKYLTVVNENTGWQTWPFNKNFHLILNVAVGGSWGGLYGVDPAIFPKQLVVDYVRVFKWVN
ncbi:MAG: family 16 glycosylhydrolase [Ignavibacteria bacterium]